MTRWRVVFEDDNGGTEVIVEGRFDMTFLEAIAEARYSVGSNWTKVTGEQLDWVNEFFSSDSGDG